MTELKYTDKEIEDWINRTNPDLLYEAQECFIDNEDVNFSALYDLYNELSFEKYGYKLLINIL